MEAIYDAGGHLDFAMSLQDDMARGKSGRIYLDSFCARHAIDLVKVRNINSPESLDAIRAYNLDWLFIIGWSQVAHEEVLSAPAKGAIGMHPTLLPVGRGRAAIPWAILRGLDITGVTMFQLDSGVDTGPIIAQKAIPLATDVDAGQLYDAVERAHVDLMREIFPRLCEGSIEPQPQDYRLATEWPGRSPEDGAMRTDGCVADAERLVRATTRPYPGAFVDLPDGRLTVWRAHIASDGVPDMTGRRSGAPVITFADGVLIADEWDWRNRSR
jgi:methionyl-tRNA formyltransferase